MIRALTSCKSLESHLESVRYVGYDCYDALNSPLLSALSRRSVALRIAFIQFFKKCPVNLRFLVGVKMGSNPKATGLFLSAVSRLYQWSGDKNYLKKLEYFSNLSLELSSKGYAGYCWGYNFDWQSRVFFVPKYTPTVVNTAFVGHGFLDAYEATRDSRYLTIARSACEFILHDLHRSTGRDGTFSFSYTPLDTLQVHNANILGASLLARVASHTSEMDLMTEARKAVQYVVNCQRTDGSWYYAETSIQKWIDSFHTGFILESLLHYREASGSAEFDDSLKKGLGFFVDHFFLSDGTPKYYHDRVFPIDIHSCAEGIVTLVRLRSWDPRAPAVLEKLVDWTLTHMQDPRGYFYFQRRRFYTNRIPYLRWAQAWMYYALAHYLTGIHGKQAGQQGVA